MFITWEEVRDYRRSGWVVSDEKTPFEVKDPPQAESLPAPEPAVELPAAHTPDWKAVKRGKKW